MKKIILALAVMLNGTIFAMYQHSNAVLISQKDDPKKAMLEAILEDNVEGVRMLLATGAAKVNDKIRDANGLKLTPLMWAALKGKPNSVSLLLEYPQIDIDARAKNKSTALLLAVTANGVEATRLLLEAGAGVNARDWNLDTALIIACTTPGSGELIDLLLTWPGVNTNAVNKAGRTPLMIAAQWNDPVVVGKLIVAGAELDEQDNYGFTALMCAASNRVSERAASTITRYLIAAGANRSLRTYDQSKNAYSIARSSQLPEVAELVAVPGSA